MRCWFAGSERSRSPGGGHGNPLQYSCLDTPMDRGAWQATVHRVPKSWTWLMWLSTVMVVMVRLEKESEVKFSDLKINQCRIYDWIKEVKTMARFPSKLSQILVYPFKCLNTVARMEVKYISITFVIQVDLEERYKLHLGISSLTIKGKSLPQCSEHSSHNSGDSLEAQHQGSVGGKNCQAK